MLVYWLGGGLNDLITAVQWSVKSDHDNSDIYSYVHILCIDAHTHTHTHTHTQTQMCTQLPAQVCMCTF